MLSQRVATSALSSPISIILVATETPCKKATEQATWPTYINAVDHRFKQLSSTIQWLVLHKFTLEIARVKC